MAPPRLFACPSCSIHVKRGEGQCPHCGAAIGPESGAVRTATAVLMGLTLSACPVAQPDYGVPATESATEATTEATTTAATTDMGTTTAATTGGTDTATGTTGTATGTATDSGTSMTTAEPEYGVPDTSGLRARDPEE